MSAAAKADGRTLEGLGLDVVVVSALTEWAVGLGATHAYLQVSADNAPGLAFYERLAPAAVLAEAGVALGGNYPRPVVDHADARALTLQRFMVVKAEESAARP